MSIGRIVVGIDIGNSTTEALVLQKTATGVRCLANHMTATTGVKGTPDNVRGCVEALDGVLYTAGLRYSDVAQIRLNQAAPVISDLSMDTISETRVIGSAMIGHNPDTPGGYGLAVGETARLDSTLPKDKPVVVLVPASIPYYAAAADIEQAWKNGVQVVAAICQKDDGVLIANRLSRVIPVVDEVAGIERVELGVPAAVEVAANGQIQCLSALRHLPGLCCFCCHDQFPGKCGHSRPYHRQYCGVRFLHPGLWDADRRGHPGRQRPGGPG